MGIRHAKGLMGSVLLASLVGCDAKSDNAEEASPDPLSCGAGSVAVDGECVPVEDDPPTDDSGEPPTDDSGEPPTDDSGDPPADDTGDSPDDSGDPPAAPSPELSTTRGLISLENLELARFPGLVGVPNLDDDDENGAPDWSQVGRAVSDNDFALATLNTNGNDIELSLEGDGIRIYQGDVPVMGEGIGTFTVTISDTEDAVGFRVEYASFLEQGRLTVRDITNDRSFVVALTASPLIFNHHLQASEQVMAVAGGWLTNDAFIDGYQAELGDSFFTASAYTYDYDVWIQDEIEFGYATSPDSHLDVIFDTLRDRGLDDFAEDQFEAPDWLVMNFGGRWDEVSTFDAGGNLEISPPVTVDGVDFPYGRVYYGGMPGGYYSEPLTATQNGLASMEIQAPFMPDTTWLCVGHIDEITTTIPDPSSPKGFRFVMADTRSAWELLESMEPSTSLPRYAYGHGFSNVGSMVSSSSLRFINTEVQEILDEQEAIFRDELGLVDDDIIYMPALFEEVSGCLGGVAALIPGTVNLVVADNTAGDTTLFMADPFLRADAYDLSSDVFIDAVRRLMPESLELVFLDDWYDYHLMLGEVHCGTNVKRTAPRTWWEDAGHLLSEEGP